mmetsp:Transcript_12172/g.10791  ORF Transcript_12172/g.10791 Transcript_12172/m.10791 type:complete len:389 (+) Transcript_12172:45-1211(+)
MYHYHHRHPLESDQKDMYISELKAENFELRHKSGHYYDLKDRVTSTEHEIAIVNDDRRRIEDEMRGRKNEDDCVIRDIQIDNEQLRGTICSRDAEIEDIKAQIEALRRQDGDLTIQISGFTKDNEGLRRDIDGLEHQLGDERGLGRRLRGDLDKAKADNTMREDENASAVHTIRVLEDDLGRNKATEEDLARILSDKNAELGDKNNRLRALEDEVAKLRAAIDGRDKEAHDLNHRYGVQLDSTNRERSELDRQLSRNADLDATVRRLEEELALLEKDICIVRDDAERLRRIFDDADFANKGLEDELNALNRHAQLLESQNVDLTKELDNIVVTDERVRADLDRRHRVTVLQNRNDEEIRDSINRLRYTRSRSPRRSCSPCRSCSPYRH